MKIGVVADTHSLEISEQLLNDLEGADLIIHAGDFCTLEELKMFRRIAEVQAVYGNMDGAELRFRFDGSSVVGAFASRQNA